MALGRIIGKMAAGAAPIATQKWRDTVVTQRDAKLNEYQTGRDKASREFSASENEKNRQQQQSQHEDTMASRERGMDIDEKRVDKVIEQLDIAIESGQLELDDKKAISSFRDQMVNAEDPAARDELFTVFMNMQGKERDDKFEFKTVQGVDPDTLERVQSLYKTNAQTGEVEFVGGMGGATQPGGSSIPQEAINDLLSDPSPEAINEFNEVFGADAANQYMGASDTAETAPTETPAAGPGLLNGSMAAGEQDSENIFANVGSDAGSDEGEVTEETAETVSGDDLSEEQVSEIKTTVEDDTYAQRMGQQAGEDLRWVLDFSGQVMQVPGRFIWNAGREAYMLLDGPVTGLGNFIKGVFQGEQ